jgi:1-acyl-sn-glycerol-3-phosphate acyltransferase
MKAISRLIIQLIGWKAVGSFPSYLKKYVVIVAPHTSGWDFIIGVLFRYALDIQKARYLGKQELFEPPFGFIFRWLGGYPVDRSGNHNMVDEVVNIFNRHDEFAIALSPEGTRKRVDKLKTGFYNIAKGAQVPIVMVGFDFAQKKVIISEPFATTENQQNDFKKIIEFFGPIQGKHPEKGLGHLLSTSENKQA